MQRISRLFSLVSILALLLTLLGNLLANAAHANNHNKRSSPEEAIAHVKRALVYIKQNGIEKAFVEFNRLDSPFNTTSNINPNGDLYMLVYQFDGMQPVHGKNPNIPGKNVYEMRDSDGVYLIKNMINICKSKEAKGWAYYKWPDSLSGAIMAKQTYVERFGEYCVGTGIYKP